MAYVSPVLHYSLRSTGVTGNGLVHPHTRHNVCMEDLIPVFLERRDIEDLYAHLRRHYGPLDSGTVSRICYALEMTFDDTSKADM